MQGCCERSIETLLEARGDVLEEGSETTTGKGMEERLQRGLTIRIILTFFLKDEGGTTRPGVAGVAG